MSHQDRREPLPQGYQFLDAANGVSEPAKTEFDQWELVERDRLLAMLHVVDEIVKSR